MPQPFPSFLDVSRSFAGRMRDDRRVRVASEEYSRLHSLEHVSGGWLADVLTRLQVRYPEVQIVFADTRAFAEDWTYRFLAAAIADATAAPVKG